MTLAPDARHITVANLESLWRNGAPTAIPIEGEPECQLYLSPQSNRLSLVTPAQEPEPDIRGLKNIGHERQILGGMEIDRIDVAVRGSIHGPYALLTTVADQLQLEGASLATALSRALKMHRRLIEDESQSSVEQQLGLWGELSVLRHLLSVAAPVRALDAWCGPMGEEHDFKFASFSAEVKTTAREERVHHIRGWHQLVPEPGRPLFLVSVQVTRTTPDAGQTLLHLVKDVRDACGAHRHRFEDALERIGWPDARLAGSRDFWTLRSTPRAYPVSSSFPALVLPAVLPNIPRADLIRDLRYQVDVSTLRYSSPPDPLSAYCEQAPYPNQEI